MNSFDSQFDFSDYSAWRSVVEEKSPTAKYWFQVMDMETILFMFISSLRESNFELFLKAFEAMLPWMAALNHINYLRWGVVFLDDMKNLPHAVRS